ncbi:VOC family protein [Nocardia sp. NPDC051463]|uniref:VOC family protein n=1 Tax=Nocardia sp. NPDC051463 TaxID=3154845 RepID=UPI00341B7E5E
MPNSFQHLHHVCIVVADLASAMAFYESVGIGSWEKYPPLSQYVDLEVPDRDAFLDLEYMYTDAAGIQIQLVQPGPGDSPQRDFLERTGGGVFHIGFTVPDVDAHTGMASSMGITPWMTGRRADGSGFTYFDTSASAGVTLEIREAPRIAE